MLTGQAPEIRHTCDIVRIQVAMDTKQGRPGHTEHCNYTFRLLTNSIELLSPHFVNFKWTLFKLDDYTTRPVQEDIVNTHCVVLCTVQIAINMSNSCYRY
jgi:hypothetical protein